MKKPARLSRGGFYLLLAVCAIHFAIGQRYVIGSSGDTPTGSPTSGQLWYNGDFNGVNGLANERNTSIGFGLFASVYDDFFVMDSGGWDVTTVFSDNLENTNVTGATWEIRQAVSEGNGGTLIASGMTMTPVVTPTGRSGFGFTEFQIAITGLAVHLPFSANPYWLNVTPTGDGSGRSFDSLTAGRTVWVCHVGTTETHSLTATLELGITSCPNSPSSRWV